MSVETTDPIIQSAKRSAATVVQIWADYHENPTTGDVIAALTRAEHLGQDHAREELWARDKLLIKAMVWLEAAGEHLGGFGMPSTGACCSETADQIRQLLRMPHR